MDATHPDDNPVTGSPGLAGGAPAPARNGHQDVTAEDVPPRLSDLGRGLILAGFVLAVGLGAATRVVYAPFLTREFARLDEWDLLAMLPGEALALAGLARFAVRHGVFGAPFPSLPTAAGLFDDRVFGRAALVFFAGLGFDALATFAVTARDEARYWRANRVAGTVERVWAVRTVAGMENPPLWIDVTFLGPDGQPRRALYKVARHPNEWLDIPRDRLWRLLRAGQVPQSMDVSYDPDDPGRNWPAGLWGVQGAERVRLWNFVWAINVLQMCVFTVFLVLLGRSAGRTGVLPGWCHLLPAVPGLAGVVTFPALIAVELGLGPFNGPG